MRRPVYPTHILLYHAQGPICRATSRTCRTEDEDVEHDGSTGWKKVDEWDLTERLSSLSSEGLETVVCKEIA